MADPADLRDLAADFPPGSLIAGTLLGAADEIDRLHELRYVKGENLRQRLAEVIRDKWDSERSAPNADMAADAVMDHWEGLPIEACHRCATDKPATPAHYCPACRTTTPAPEATAEALVRAGVDHRAACAGTADLRQRIAAAIASIPVTIGPNSLALLQHGHTLGLTGGEIEAMAFAVEAELQPELAQRPGCPDPVECDHEAAAGQALAEAAQLRAELDRTRAELAEARYAWQRLKPYMQGLDDALKNAATVSAPTT